jgi:hypothetical protein
MRTTKTRPRRRKIGLVDSKRLIDGVLGGTCSKGTVNDWRGKFGAKAFILNDFLRGNYKTFNGFSDKSLDALIVYEAGIKPQPTINQTTNRINGLFGENTVTSEKVQVSFQFFYKVIALFIFRPPI